MKLYAVHPAVSLREELDGALLYNADMDDVLVINETGSRIWKVLAKPKSVADITAYLQEHMDGAENVREDVEAFVDSLLPNFLVVCDETAAL